MPNRGVELALRESTSALSVDSRLLSPLDTLDVVAVWGKDWFTGWLSRSAAGS
jgi:hypothetical protein